MTAPKTARDWALDMVTACSLTPEEEDAARILIVLIMSAARAEGVAAGRAEGLEEAAQSILQWDPPRLELASSVGWRKQVAERIRALATKREGNPDE